MWTHWYRDIAIDEQTAQRLRDACESVRQDDNARVCVITGDGAFCVGTEFADGEPAPDQFTRLWVGEAVAAIEKPTIALIGGDAIDQGLELVLACECIEHHQCIHVLLGCIQDVQLLV